MPLNFSSSNILVVGDLMLDKYWSGSTHRTSPEAPVIVVNVSDEDYRVGGAGNVAINCKTLGANVSLLGLTGKDNEAACLKKHLENKGVFHYLQQTDNLKTITKLRVLSHKQQTIRLDFEDSYQDIDKATLNHYYSEALVDADVVILSDYAKGTLSDPQALIQAARKLNKPVLVDPKGNDFAKYRGASLLKPNKKEFELIVGPCKNQKQLIEKGQTLLDTLDIDTLLLTLGEEGMLLIEKSGAVGHVAANSKELIDVTGAGDTVIATFANAIASGKSHLAAMHIANLAAGIAVSKSGTAEVTLNELNLAYLEERSFEHGITTAQKLKLTVNQLKAQGKKVVFTNGCFDLLHAGHIAYLKKAKALGDKLIVAINSDASIKRLKGESRPVSPQESRVEVLAALRFVDWVIVFDEDTPENLLRLLEPSILVKGGDYSIDGVVGASLVQAYGGEVKVLKHDFLHMSSSNLIARASM